MLQWMGGSRRKVTASRKSTHNRQKQYFEQRKRQQQAPGQESYTDTSSKRANCHEGSRSLDVLSLINTTPIVQQGCSNDTSGFGVSQVDPCHSQMLKPLPRVMLKQTVAKNATDYEQGHKATCSESSMLFPEKCSTGSQNLSTAQSLNGGIDGLKVALSASKVVSNNTYILPDEETQNEISVLDLLSDDGPRSDTGGSVPENHVAFSVEGLGKVWIGTPTRSPRNLTSPPKASRLMHTTAKLKSIKYDLGSKLLQNTIINEIRISHEGKSSKVVCNNRDMTDDFDKKESIKFKDSYISQDVSDNKIGCFIDEDETIYPSKYCRKEQWHDKFDILEDGFPEEKSYNAAWKINPACTSGSPSISLGSERTEGDFVDPYSNSTRISGHMCKRFHISAPSTRNFRHLTSEGGCNFLSFDWGRSSPVDESSSFEKMFDMHAWSLSATDDTQDRMSLLSEESCSSAAVEEDRSHDVRAHSVNLGRSKFNDMNGFDMNLEEKNNLKHFFADETICAELGEKYQDSGRNFKRVHNEWIKDHCSDKSSVLPDIVEGDYTSFFREGYASVKETFDPNICHSTLEGANKTYFSHNLMSEDNLVDQFTIPSFSPNVDLGNRSFKPFSPDDIEPFKNMSEDERIGRASGSVFQMQKPATRSLGSEVQFSGSTFATDFLKDTESSHLLSRGDIGKDDEAFRCFGLPQNIPPMANKSISSVVDGNLSGEDNKNNCTEHENSEVDTEVLLNGPIDGNAPEKGEDSSTSKKEVSRQLKYYIDDEPDLSDGNSLVPFQVARGDSRKEKSEAERKDSEKEGGSCSDMSHHMMLGSYVLQLLCVQHVHMGASEKDIVKKGDG